MNSGLLKDANRINRMLGDILVSLSEIFVSVEELGATESFDSGDVTSRLKDAFDAVIGAQFSLSYGVLETHDS